MLIHKGNFLIVKLAATVLVALLAWCATAAPRAGPVAPAAPDAVAVAFYGWYLDTLAADQDPLSDRRERFAVYVARDLEARLAQRLRSGGVPQADYFLQAAHYHADWLRRQVHAVTVRQRSQGRERLADVIVTLGAGGESTRTLALSMVLEDGLWKIRQVDPARDGSLESSAEQSVI
ncbi:DUF3828 domain-containing protein [uncultured Massilia sp.]|uniref:DUF3828 domain-containing protein n=1 Tax=uncultured Massilia sp. TaxID=169973 RepID=UPI0025F28027|nr:DUF3828 domain-containing protein [uncultured Massilia sp.]